MAKRTLLIFCLLSCALIAHGDIETYLTLENDTFIESERENPIHLGLG